MTRLRNLFHLLRSISGFWQAFPPIFEPFMVAWGGMSDTRHSYTVGRTLEQQPQSTDIETR
jgi:hypothetical protein